MPLDISFDCKDMVSNLSDKYLAMTLQERQQFFYGQFHAKQKTQPNWSGLDWSDKTDKTIKFKHTGSIIEII